MNIPYIAAKSLSYSGTRSYSNIYYIIIHYTGISNDTAENNAKYFANGNTRSAGAHFFVDQKGSIYQSVKMSYTANSVPRKRQGWSGGGTYLGKCTSANSISIEMCDNLSKDPSAAQTEAVRQLVEYIQSVCPNAKTIVRHYDVTGKLCPARMIDEKKWAAFKSAITTKPAQNTTTVPKEEDDMTSEDWKKIQTMIDTSISNALNGRNLPPSDWAVKEGVIKWAEDNPLIDASRPQGVTKREETWAYFKRNEEKKAGGDND